MNIYIVEFKYFIRYAPSTGAELKFVYAKTPNEAIRLVADNHKVQHVLGIWLLGKKCAASLVHKPDMLPLVKYCA